MPPAGHLAVGGPLIDSGHQVRLIDAETGPLSISQAVAAGISWAPDVVLVGHSGSTSAHPTIAELARALKMANPRVPIVYGGLYPSYHAEEVLSNHHEIDVIIRGEGEDTTRRLVAALESGDCLSTVNGIAYRDHGVPRLTAPALTIQNLDAFRVGWELIENWDDYQYWGAGRAAVIQFSRGCPHRCSYCGQRGFWTRWRYRDPHKVAAQIGWLYRTHRVGFVDLADENPTTLPRLWRTFLEALISQNVPVQLVGTMRASDIVRDAEFLHLYKKAGFSRILMGMESTDPDTLMKIRKDATTTTDREAIKLLRQHDILSQAAYVVGFEEETDRQFLHGLRQLLLYDPDQVNAMYVTPHRWTPFYRESAGRRVVELDKSRWDYRHQVLGTRIPSWRVFLWVKLTEAILQLRPRALWRVIAHRDLKIRRALRWCYGVGARAWLFEMRSFLRPRRRQRSPRQVTLAQFWGAPGDAHEEALRPAERPARSHVAGASKTGYNPVSMKIGTPVLTVQVSSS